MGEAEKGESEDSSLQGMLEVNSFVLSISPLNTACPDHHLKESSTLQNPTNAVFSSYSRTYNRADYTTLLETGASAGIWNTALLVFLLPHGYSMVSHLIY